MGYASQKKMYWVSFKGREHFFQSKFAAKEFGRKQGLKGVIVHRGPDHPRGRTDGTSFQMAPQGTKKKVADDG